MPIYEYLCGKCGNNFERLWNDLNSIPIMYPCPQCNGAANRIISNFSIGKSYNQEQPRIVRKLKKIGSLKFDIFEVIE